MLTLETKNGCPSSEYSTDFLQGMVSRMATSYFKYGAVADAYPNKVNAIASLEKRLALYKETGNLEWLMDLANFAMIEYMRPLHHKAHFRATDSTESPGRKWIGEVDSSHRGNRPETWED